MRLASSSRRADVTYGAWGGNWLGGLGKHSDSTGANGTPGSCRGHGQRRRAGCRRGTDGRPRRKSSAGNVSVHTEYERETKAGSSDCRKWTSRRGADTAAGLYMGSGASLHDFEAQPWWQRRDSSVARTVALSQYCMCMDQRSRPESLHYVFGDSEPSLTVRLRTHRRKVSTKSGTIIHEDAQGSLSGEKGQKTASQRDSTANYLL